MRAAQLQPPAAQQARTHSAHPQLPPQVPHQPEPPTGASTPLKQQLVAPVGIPATPAARASAARLPSWSAGSFGHAASMPAATVNLELSEETLFREDLSGQDPAVGDDMSSEGEDDSQLHQQQQQQQQRPAAGGTPGSAFRSAPGQPGGGLGVSGGADSGSDSSDEDIGKEFAQAAELHRSSSAGALTGSAPQSPVGAFAPGTPGSGGATAALQAGGASAGGGQGPDADQLIPAFGATPARPRRPVSTPSPTPISRKKLAMDSAASQLGTSVPIAIPMGLREERDSTPDSPEEPGGIHAATFVPPHMLEQARSGALELTNSVHGTSPAASLKRERLVNRNAILRRTGFLEGSQGAAFLETMDPIRESAFESPTPPLATATPGALSRALGSAAGSSM